MARPKPAVFISHSAKDDPVASGLLDAIFDRLTAEGFDVLLDRKRLAAGYEWQPYLHTWMAHCRASIILFSRNVFEAGAVKSNWVLKEATVLAYRQSQDARFVLVPVLLPDASAEELKKGPFEPVSMGAIQAVSGAEVGTLPEKIAAALERLKSETTPTPMEELESKIADHLEVLSDDRLDKLEDLIGADLGGWQPGVDRARRIAIQLMQISLDRLPKVMESLAGTKIQYSALKILDMIWPVWVDPDAAIRLAGVARRAGSPRAAALNATRDFVAEAYVARACRRYPSWTTVPVVNKGGEHAAGAMVKEVLVSLKQYMRPGASEEEIRRSISRDKEPVIVILRPPLPHPDILEGLRTELPLCTLFLLAGATVPEPLPAALEYVEVLRPPLEPGAEDDAIDTYNDAYRFVGRASRVRE